MGVAVSVTLAVALPNGVLVLVAVSVGVASGVAVGVLEAGDGGCVGVTLAVRLAVGVAVGVGSAGQPVSALFTALTSTSMVTAPSPLASKAGQTPSPIVPSAMSTPVISSSTVTVLEPSQSPMQVGVWANVMRALSRTSKGPHASRRGNERRSMLQPGPAASLLPMGRSLLRRGSGQGWSLRASKSDTLLVTREAARNTQREKGGAQRACSSPMPMPLPVSGGSPRACRASFMAAR